MEKVLTINSKEIKMKSTAGTLMRYRNNFGRDLIKDMVHLQDKLKKVNIEGNIVTAEAGVSLISLANTCMKEGLNGLAFAGGIPGLVGASTAMNAGAYKEDMASIVREVKVITPELKIITMSNKELNYAYRNSFLKENKDYTIIKLKR